MRVRIQRIRTGEERERGFLPRLMLLALCFAAGVILGQVMAVRMPDGVAQELERYLSDYFSLGVEQPGRAVWLSTLLVYFRYPLLAFLLGFSSVGVVLLPALSAACGFFLSFSVCCFTASFGGGGVLLCLAVFGLRCCVMLPCYFALAVPSMRNAIALAALSFGRGKRAQPVRYDRAWWTRLGITAALLTLGVLADLFLTPGLLELALEHILS